MKNSDTKWKIREMAALARTSVTLLLSEAGVSRATVSRWDRQLSSPRASTIQRINAAAERMRERAKG